MTETNSIKENANMGFAKMATGVFAMLNTIPYKIPTAIRNFREIFASPKSYFYTREEDCGGITGILTGVYGLILQIELYKDAVAHGHSEALLIPVATNIISSLYESGKKERERKKAEEQKAKRKADEIDMPKPKSIDGIVE